MTAIRLHNVAILLLSTSMVIIGYLGLVGEIQMSTTLMVAGLVSMVVLSFTLGRQSTHLYGT